SPWPRFAWRLGAFTAPTGPPDHGWVEHRRGGSVGARGPVSARLLRRVSMLCLQGGLAPKRVRPPVRLGEKESRTVGGFGSDSDSSDHSSLTVRRGSRSFPRRPVKDGLGCPGQPSSPHDVGNRRMVPASAPLRAVAFLGELGSARTIAPSPASQRDNAPDRGLFLGDGLHPLPWCRCAVF